LGLVPLLHEAVRLEHASDPAPSPCRAQSRHIFCTMKVAMLLVWVLFLATAVEALSGGGGRQLKGKGKGKGKGKVDCSEIMEPKQKAKCCKKQCKNKAPKQAKKACKRACKKTTPA